MKHTHAKQGFTLMEMLIVVAIIAVLVAIAIPAFSKSLEKSRRAVDLATARDIMAVFAAEVNDGTIELPAPESSVWVEIHKNPVGKSRILYGKGTKISEKGSPDRPVIDGTPISDADNERNTTIANLLFRGGLSPESLAVKATDTNNNGWDWYAVWVQGDGTVGVCSGVEGSNAKRRFNNYGDLASYVRANPHTNIATAMGR